MGYTTEFSGVVHVVPALNTQEIEFLTKFSETRRMKRRLGHYFVDGGGFMGQDHDPDVIDYNRPIEGQPGLWCQWRPTADGTAIEWDGGEKFYCAAEWMKYIIQHFLAPGAHAKKDLPFLQANHICNGEVEAQGEDSDDRWDLVVDDNKVSTRTYSRAVGPLTEV